jgi:hypothetical protein
LNQKSRDTNPKTEKGKFFIDIGNVAKSIFLIEVKEVFDYGFDNAERNNDCVVDENEVGRVFGVE